MPAKLNEENIELYENNTLSELDKAYMTIMYPRASAHTNTPDWTFEHALDVVKMNPKTKATLIQHWQQNDIDKVRKTFNAWNAIMQSTQPRGKNDKGASSLQNLRQNLAVANEVASQIDENSS
jgi:hypothetical protein